MTTTTAPRAAATIGETAESATIYRMVMDKHVCPYGLKARDLLRRRGYRVLDHWLTTRAEVDAFKAKYQVKTTPQAFIGDERVGGYDDLRRYFKLPETKARSYRPVLAVFGVALLMALAAGYAVGGAVLGERTLRWFIAFSMCALALLKLQNVETFSSTFLSYDLLARRWVRYAYLYPFAELAAGALMAAGALVWVSAPLALVIGGIGTVSVIKAVYIDKREIKCACVGGDSNVPLGFLSLTENLMMIAMGVWMLVETYGHLA
jgi:glutaredoxin